MVGHAEQEECLLVAHRVVHGAGRLGGLGGVLGEVGGDRLFCQVLRVAEVADGLYVDLLPSLEHLGLVAETQISVRVHSGTQFFKLYVINDEDAFFGYYPIRPNKVVAQGETIEIYDLVGKDATLFHHSINDGESSSGAQQVQQARMWFDSVWETIGRDFDLDAR